MIKELMRFIEKDVLPNQLKYSLYLVGGLIVLIIFIFVVGK
jgi:uncharacterized integral membrane protein